MPAPRISLSDAAARAIADALPDGATSIRLRISPAFAHDLSLAAATDDDVRVEMPEGLTIVIDPDSATRADGVTIDYSDGAQGPGFTIRNPQQPPGVVQLSALELQAMRERGEVFELVDVRTPQEQATAAIDGARLLDRDYHTHLLGLDHDTPLVFQCHHGIRSQSAAEYFVEAGFRKVYNLRGGIDAWSLMVDPTVPRY